MGTYLVTHNLTLIGQQIRNTFYYITSVGEPSNAEWQVAADEIAADWTAQIRPAVTTQMTIDSISRRRVDLIGLLSFLETFTGGAVPGTSGVDPLATQLALVVSNKGTTVKPNRGRTYLCGFDDADMVGSLWTAAAITAAETFIDLQSNLNAAGANPLARVAAQWNANHTQVILTNDLSGAASVGSTIPGTQRRRRIGVGI